MYQDLAKKTYSRLFNEELHFFSRNLNEVKSLITASASTLPSRTQQKLYYYELVDLLQNDKISKIGVQQQKYRVVLMTNYEEILQLHRWLEEKAANDTGVNRLAIEDQIPWWQTQNSLLLLTDLLHNAGYLNLNEKDFFVSAFLAKNGQRVTWLGTTTLLIYLVTRLREEKFINKTIPINALIKECFLDKKGSEILNIKQSKLNYSNTLSGKPTHYNKIESIIEQIKN